MGCSPISKNSFKVSTPKFGEKSYNEKEHHQEQEDGKRIVVFVDNNPEYSDRSSEKFIEFTFKPQINEKMFPLWVEKNAIVKFIISGEWGFNELGLVDYRGYDGKLNNLRMCSLLYRVGFDKKFFEFKTFPSKKGEIITIKAESSGQLFLMMNVTKEITFNNQFNLDGELQIKVSNVARMDYISIFESLGWESTYLSLIAQEITSFSTYKGKSILFFLNLLRGNPKLFADLFFRTSFNNFDIDLLNEKDGHLNILKENENLVYIAQDSESKTLSEKVSKLFTSKSLNLNDDDIIEIEIFLYTDNELEIIFQLLESEKGHYLLKKGYNYIGINLEKTEHMKNFKCSCVLSTKNA